MSFQFESLSYKNAESGKLPDFLAENNLCGQTILHLVSRGNAIVAELLRLKDYIPKIFRLETKAEIQKYGDVILDFGYFKVSESHDNKIEHSEVLRDLDEEFRDNHVEIINRFYLTFESIHTYVCDLNHFIDELEEGAFIHQTLENVFSDIEGKQLMCEALYLYGLMLLLVDVYIEGTVRERILVSYYRYTPQRRDTQSCIDEVCKLLRETNFHSAKKPANYPEEYFKRIPINATFVDMVIGRLRAEDIYSQILAYPLPKHRSTALANQAAMLYVCLFFSPNILHNQTAVMREIVDKYFPDNWVISLYMGYTLNLAESWEAFKAAKLALNNTLEHINVKSYANTYGGSVMMLLKSTALKLKEGNITNETLLKDVNGIISLLRECNVTLRWLVLHTVQDPVRVEKNKKLKQLRELVVTESKYEQVQLFKLLLNTAQLEQVTKDMYKSLLMEKENHWTHLQQESYKSLVELSEVFSGSKPLSRIQKNEKLEQWFLEISKQINSLEQKDGNSSRKLVQLIQALEEVQEFHQLNTNMQVIQYLSETRNFLDQMIRLMNVKEDILITLQIIGDLSYAWELIDVFTPIMQQGIKKEPTLVRKLRSIFLKLASALEVPLLRINQAHSDDMISVSQYYSSELEIYVRKVLQIIPKMMFDKLAKIIEMQTSVLRELPTRLDKDKLKDYAQLNERFEFAQLTHSIAVFSQGMRMMKSTLVGVVCLDPKQLLEDGIRKELVQYISKALHTELIFNSKSKVYELEQKLKHLGQIMDGYKRSFEYIQDYININGLKIWQEEVTRIINYNVEQECNGFLRSKIHDWESVYQSRYVPIPHYPPTDNLSANFIGRLAREVIKMTDPKTSVFIDQTTTWYDIKTHKPIFNKQSVASIMLAVEVAGLVGLDKLFSFMIISSLQKVCGFLEKKGKSDPCVNILSNICAEFQSKQPTSNPTKFYQNCIGRTVKVWPELIDEVLFIGQLQLLRKIIAFQLNTSSKFDAKNLESSLKSLNMALLLEIRKESYTPSEKLMRSLSNYFDYSGLNDPFQKVYVTSNYNVDYGTILFVLTISFLPKMFLINSTGQIHKRTQDQLDGATFAIAIYTIFKQFHSNLNDTYIRLCSEYLVDISKHYLGIKLNEMPLEVTAALNFLSIYTNYGGSLQESLGKYLPQEILHLQQTVISAGV